MLSCICSSKVIYSILFFSNSMRLQKKTFVSYQYCNVNTIKTKKWITWLYSLCVLDDLGHFMGSINIFAWEKIESQAKFYSLYVSPRFNYIDKIYIFQRDLKSKIAVRYHLQKFSSNIMCLKYYIYIYIYLFCWRAIPSNARYLFLTLCLGFTPRSTKRSYLVLGIELDSATILQLQPFEPCAIVIASVKIQYI